ncbi:MAG: tRNA 2-thiocytidine(32) synthetase TtcA [Deltaproteobacteria bacterium]|nr:MAG: tRNA 2-thiocytidine(32) synthetase TtcA [Deltaproteobacteria bacterium]
MRKKGVDALMHSLMGKAIGKFGLIEDGDRLLVCVSGGHDSMVLLYLLQTRLSFIPVNYELHVLHIDLGFPGGESDRLEAYLENFGLPYTRVKTEIGPLSHSEANWENPCFMCSRMRKKLIFQTAERLGYNKIVMGHNRDDVLETFFLNMAFSGEISTMIPMQSFFDGMFLLIRPFYLIDEDVIRRYARRHEIPSFHDGCPTGKNSKRALIRSWLETLYPHNRKIKGTLFHALSNVKPDYLPKNL